MGRRLLCFGGIQLQPAREYHRKTTCCRALQPRRVTVPLHPQHQRHSILHIRAVDLDLFGASQRLALQKNARVVFTAQWATERKFMTGSCAIHHRDLINLSGEGHDDAIGLRTRSNLERESGIGNIDPRICVIHRCRATSQCKRTSKKECGFHGLSSGSDNGKSVKFI